MAKKATPLNVIIDERVWMRDEGWMGEHAREIHEWTITITGTRYHCVIRECSCGLRREIGVTYKRVAPDAPKEVWNAPREIEAVHSVALTNCTCKSEAHRGPKPSERDRVCHGWHRARIDKFFDHLKKHGTAKPERSAPVGIARGNFAVPFVGVGYVHRDAERSQLATRESRLALIDQFSRLIE
jgi:hypothetical protein